MSNFEDNPSVSHKPIDVVKTQLHIIQSEVQELKNDIHKLHTINKSILKVLIKKGMIKKRRRRSSPDGGFFKGFSLIFFSMY